jgi:ketosteroid isomerase-like protein
VKDTADAQTAKEMRAWTEKRAELYNKHDASGYAAFFTEDPVQVTPEGMIYSRQAIEKKFANDFQQRHPTDFAVNVHHFNTIGNTLSGSVIGTVMPAVGQDKNTVDPEVRQQIEVALKKYDEAANKNDAAAVSANFTEDAVNVEQEGPTFCRNAIEKLWADSFQKVHFSNNLVTVDEDSPHITTDGKQMWATGAWSAIIQRGEPRSYTNQGILSMKPALERAKEQVRSS